MKFLSSLKLAVFLLASMAGMYVVAALYGDMDVYHQWPFRAIMLLFALNLTLCTVKQLPTLWRTLRRDAGSISAAGGGYETLTMAGDETAEAACKAFCQKQRYQIKQAEEDGVLKILAVKGRLGLVAPHLLHLSILVILAGAFLTSFGQSGAVALGPGTSHGLPAAVQEMVGESEMRYKDFVTVYDDESHVDNWITTFDLIIDGQVVAEDAQTMVNHPFKYRQLSIYQNSYQNQYVIAITGEQAGDYMVPDSRHIPLGEREFMLASLSDGQVLCKVYENDEVVSGQIVAPGDVVEVFPGTTIEYLMPNHYTILEVKASPGTNVVFLGFILATLASMLFWSGRYRELRLRIHPAEGTVEALVVCKSAAIGDETKKLLRQFIEGGD